MRMIGKNRLRRNHVRRRYYVAIGDSLTKGIGCKRGEKPFPDYVFESIRQTPECSYMNLGCSGLTSSDLISFIDRSGVYQECMKATEISITIGGNDLMHTFHKNGSILHYLWTIQRIGRNLDRIMSKIKSINQQAVIMIMGLYNPGTRKDPNYHTCNILVKPLNWTYQRVSKKYKALFINPYWELLDQPNLMSDTVHPNHQGYQVISRLFVENLARNIVR